MRGELPPADDIARAVAEELAQPKYRMGTPWWARLIDFLERLWIQFVEWVTRVSEFLGGPLVTGLLVALVLGITAAVVTANLGRRRARRIDERIRREHEAARGLDPVALERQAAEAEATGDYSEAMRYLFRALLVRLDRAGLIDLRPGTTTGTVAESLHSTDFERVAQRFDAVVYGGRPATTDDPELVRLLQASLLDRATA
ncbi:MAG TPA: DUF4129 domain-containing protein [Acidimicrobiia bacterium]|nr:DUF4129 domain-containing protein [Acidimicrobiia bacterium]